MPRRTESIVVTWPKTRPFGSYMAELELARARGLVVCFRVPRLPQPTPKRCYRVHDGMVKGWLRVIECRRFGEREVSRVRSEAASGFWPAGDYVVCDPRWHEIDIPVPMPGFQGWRWFER